tara:strand:+ start:362 stop:544 length:183 start_codon:yes stop_codon:yes gene_type:complete
MLHPDIVAHIRQRCEDVKREASALEAKPSLGEEQRKALETLKLEVARLEETLGKPNKDKQ